jgi:hypothetical protein
MKARFQLSILADGNTLSVGSDATVALKLPGTSTAATIYSNSAGTATTTNPLSADSNGNVACYVTPGRYDLTITTADGTVTLTDYEILGIGLDAIATAGASHQATAQDNGICRTFAQSGNVTYTVLASAPVGTLNFAINAGGGDMVFAFGTDSEVNGYTTIAAGKMGCAAKIGTGLWVLIGDAS